MDQVSATRGTKNYWRGYSGRAVSLAGRYALVRNLAPNLWEVRSTIGNRIARVLFSIEGDVMVLLHGFIKQTQKTSPQDLALAQKRLKQWRG